MSIVVPVTTDNWTRMNVPRGTCAQVSVPPGTRSMVWAELPSEGDTCLSVNVGEGASCELLTVQEAATGTVKAVGRIAAGGALRWRPVTIGGTVRHEIRSTCTGDGARSEASWIVIAPTGSHPQAVIRNTFDARNGGGEVAMRAVALAHGRALLDGRIEIGLGGGGTQTYLTQEALMLDATAKIDAIPGLEIKTNDVKASHSATVSRVHPEDVFYAGSRGIDPADATRMFIEGFVGKLCDDIRDDALREQIVARVIRSLER